MIDLNEIKSRINQVYQYVLGAESHERKMLCDEIERLTKLVSSYKTITTSHEKQICALTEALEFMYDKWENGTACYEEHEGFVGNAFTLDDDDENRILRLIPSCLNGNKPPKTPPHSKQ